MPKRKRKPKLSRTLYGPTPCPTCGRKIYAILLTPKGGIPPARVGSGCDSHEPPFEVWLYYAKAL